jgi:hypothetical protein
MSKKPRTEDQLLAQVAHIYQQLDPVPELVAKAARAAFELRDLDSQLIPLVDALSTTPVRSGTAQNFMSFALDDLEVDLGGSADRFGWRLVGQIVGAVSTVVVQSFSGTEQVSVDEHGRFSLVISAPTLCLKIQTPDGRQLRTQWVTFS